MSENNTERLKTEQFIYEDGKLEDRTTGGAQKNLILSFITQLKPGMDVTRIQAPTWILRPKSYLEASSEYVWPTDAVVDLEKEADPEKRIIAVAQWIIGNLTVTPQKGFNRAKPYNPILGEQFFCDFQHENSTTHFYAEQVSHHPPITALVMENKQKHFVYTSTTVPKSTFWGNKVDMTIEGDHHLYFTGTGEHYALEFPIIVGRNILIGSSVLEHNEAMVITCEQTGYKFTLEFLKKKSNEVDGYIEKDKEKCYKLSGHLDKKITITHLKTKETNTFIDAATCHNGRAKRVIKPVSEQKENESRRVWHDLTCALYHNDFDKAGKYKTIVEEKQRKLAKERKDKNEEWALDEFVLTDKKTKSGVGIYQWKKLDLSRPTASQTEIISSGDLD